MSSAFQYKPRFKDMRVKPPKPEEEAAEADVLHLKPGEKPCQWPDCRMPATARAPKSRERLNDFYDFCQRHAGEYNKGWNFYAGMTEGEVRAAQENEAMTGGRPTWEMKAGRMSREAAAFATNFRRGQGYRDYHELFGRGRQAKPEPEARRIGKIERGALADLDLDEHADGPKIRSRYTELVRRLHPDANQGDRSGEHRLQRVIRAYQQLRKAGMV